MDNEKAIPSQELSPPSPSSDFEDRQSIDSKYTNIGLWQRVDKCYV